MKSPLTSTLSPAGRVSRSPASKARTILVTGASGFVGRYLMAHLRSLHVNAIPCGGDATAFDIRDAAAVDAAIRNERPDAVIHLAAMAAPALARDNARQAWDINVTGTFNLAQAVMTYAPDANFILIGSSESYGTSFNAHAGAITENAPFAPTSPYGATKAAADIMVGQMAQDGLRAIRLRPFNHAGPGQAPGYVVSDFARQIALIEMHGEGALRTGNLDAARDFLDVRDVVRAYAAAALSDDIAPGSAINIATGQPLTLRAVVDRLIAASTARIPVEADPSRLRPGDIARASGDPSRAATLLNWRPAIPFGQTLSDVLAYWRGEVAKSHDR